MKPIDTTYISPASDVLPGQTGYGFLARLWMWLSAMGGLVWSQPCGEAIAAPAQDRAVNRHIRRMNTKPSFPPSRNIGVIRRLLPQNLTPAQFAERLAHISIHGRIGIYRMQYWTSAVYIRERLLKYTDGWACEFIGAAGRINTGLCAAHAVPG